MLFSGAFAYVKLQLYEEAVTWCLKGLAVSFDDICNFWRLSARIRQELEGKQKGLGTACVRHDGYNAVYKVIACHVVRHSRPASVA